MINWQAVLFPDQICVSNDAAEKPYLKHSLLQPCMYNKKHNGGIRSQLSSPLFLCIIHFHTILYGKFDFVPLISYCNYQQCKTWF